MILPHKDILHSKIEGWIWINRKSEPMCKWTYFYSGMWTHICSFVSPIVGRFNIYYLVTRTFEPTYRKLCTNAWYMNYIQIAYLRIWCSHTISDTAGCKHWYLTSKYLFIPPHGFPRMLLLARNWHEFSPWHMFFTSTRPESSSHSFSFCLNREYIAFLWGLHIYILTLNDDRGHRSDPSSCP